MEKVRMVYTELGVATILSKGTWRVRELPQQKVPPLRAHSKCLVDDIVTAVRDCYRLIVDCNFDNTQLDTFMTIEYYNG